LGNVGGWGRRTSESAGHTRRKVTEKASPSFPTRPTRRPCPSHTAA
jgi:hypothetical protein